MDLVNDDDNRGIHKFRRLAFLSSSKFLDVQPSCLCKASKKIRSNGNLRYNLIVETSDVRKNQGAKFKITPTNREGWNRVETPWLVGQAKLANRVCFHNNLDCTSAIKWSLLNYSTGFPQKVHLTNPHTKKHSAGKTSPPTVWIKIHQLLYPTANWWRQKPSPDPKWVEHVENEHSIPFFCWFKNWILIPENTCFLPPRTNKCRTGRRRSWLLLKWLPFQGTW